MSDTELDSLLTKMAVAWIEQDADRFKGGEKLIKWALKFGGLTQERLTAGQQRLSVRASDAMTQAVLEERRN